MAPIMRVAVAQLRSAPLDAAANGRRGVAAIAAAAPDGADLVVLPELMACGSVLDRARLQQLAEPASGTAPALRQWHAAAAKHEIAFVAGFAERDGTALFNSATVIDRDGAIAGLYRELHLFGDEGGMFAPGDLGLLVVTVDGLHLGVLICFDLRFPEVLRILAAQRTAVVAVPTAWVDGFDPQPVRESGTIGQVDGAQIQANLNQLYIACAGQVGCSRGLSFLGRPVTAGRTAPCWPARSAQPPKSCAPSTSTLTRWRRRATAAAASRPAQRRTEVYDELLGYRPVIASRKETP